VVVARSMQMAESLKVPALGLVENMSYFICPHCGQKTYFYGQEETEKLARRFGTDLIVRIPISLDLARLPAEGLKPESSVVAEVLDKLGTFLINKLK